MTHPGGRTGEKPGSMEQVLGQHWHEVPDADVLALLGANRDVGLDAAEASRRRDRFGANALTERRGQSPTGDHAVTAAAIVFGQMFYIFSGRLDPRATH